MHARLRLPCDLVIALIVVAFAVPVIPWGARLAQAESAATPTLSTRLNVGHAPDPRNDTIAEALDFPTEEVGMPCLGDRASCDREPWWLIGPGSQSSAPTHFKLLGPTLTMERRYAEAIALLWECTEGQDLLRDAAERGASIRTSTKMRKAFAAYSPSSRVVSIHGGLVDAPVWLLADVIAHELKHAFDEKAGLRQGTGFKQCVASEQAAYQVEARFTRWIYERFGRLPPAKEVAKLLPDDVFELYVNVDKIASADDVDALAFADYRKPCAA